MTAIATYPETIARMERFSDNWNVLQWSSEWNERNYGRMKRIADLLCSIQPDSEVPNDIQKEIKSIGLAIHKEGGFDTQQACFYVLVNFMTTNQKVKELEYIWHEVGDWKC